MDLTRLAQVLRQDCTVEPQQRLVLGFSGGPDSLALLHALHSIGQPLVVAHLDHGLRAESAGEAQAAGKTAASLGLLFCSERVDVAALAKERKHSLEEAAREARYRFLFRVAGQQKAAAVAVAHTADDQAETLLMHLLRGAGPAGLRGMAMRSLPNSWSSEIALVRPLLGFWRQEVLDYCAAHNLHPVMDASNLDTTFFRNRLRHELLPLLENQAPGFKARLAQTADLLRGDQALIDALVEEAWRHCLAQEGEGFVRLDRSCLMREPLALQRGALRRAFSVLRPEQRELDYVAVQRAIDLFQNAANTAPADWFAGLCLHVEGDKLWIADWQTELPVDWPQAPEPETHLEIPIELNLNAGWRLTIRATKERNADANGEAGALGMADPFQVKLDAHATDGDLVLRRRKAGDRFQPLGMAEGSMKLSDFMINEKMPLRARDAWPLICRGDKIVWVPGYRLAHPFRLQAGSRPTLLLRLER